MKNNSTFAKQNLRFFGWETIFLKFPYAVKKFLRDAEINFLSVPIIPLFVIVAEAVIGPGPIDGLFISFMS